MVSVTISENSDKCFMFIIRYVKIYSKYIKKIVSKSVHGKKNTDW